MKRWCFIFLLFAGVLSSAQTREEQMARINHIKLDTEHYLYGAGTGENQEWTEKDATLELSDQVATYCRGRQFSFIHSLEDVPKDSIHFISYARSESNYRGIAYLPKRLLEESESGRKTVLENEGRLIRMRAFMEDLKGQSDIDSVRSLLAKQDGIKYGESLDDESQVYVVDSFLVYFDYRSGSVLEIMTPELEGRKRRDWVTGAITSTRKYKTTPILWIYIEGFCLNL